MPDVRECTDEQNSPSTVKCMFCWKGDEQHKNESVLFQGFFFFLIFKIIVETDLVEKETLGLIHVLNIVFEMIYTTIL